MDNIKLIVTDLDGTLLDDHKNMPGEMPAILDELDARGIHFVAASGRQFYNIRAQFQGMENRIDYIAENGGMVAIRDQIIFCDAIDKALLRELVEVIRRKDGCWGILCGKECAYYEDDFEEMTTNVNMYYKENRLVDDLMAYIDADVICKIAVYASHTAETTAYPALLPYADRMQVALSGDCWVDVMNSTITKGEALKVLLDHYQLSPEECMGFGDYLNDLPLLKVCGHPYSMDNGHPDLRKEIPASGGNNNENGVVKTLCRELDIQL